MKFEIEPPLSSLGNQRLKEAYAGAPELINKEFTLPVPVVSLYEAPLVAKTSGLRHIIEDHMRVIITPPTYQQLSPARKKEVSILSSPYESGRVLEADQEVLIGGDPKTLSIKGGGATTFYRETGAINPWMTYGIFKPFTKEQKQALQTYPFWKYAGLLTQQEAFMQLHASRELAAQGIRTEKILGIYALEALPDEKGELRPLSYFVEQGIIEKDANPVLMARLMKSNFRLLEPILFKKLKRPHAAATFIDYALKEFGKREKITNRTMQNYTTWLSGEILAQELPLIMQGYSTGSAMWQDLGRNISLHAEELDVEGISPLRFDSVMDYSENIHTAFMKIENLLRVFIETNNSTRADKVNYGEYAATFWNQLTTTLDSLDFRLLHRQICERIENSYKPSLRDFIWVSHNTIYGWFKNYIFIGEDREGTKLYQKYILDQIAHKKFTN